MSEDIVFYTNPMSRGRTVRWMLEEVGEPYSTEVVDYGPAMKSDAYIAINPMGKVPALTHRGVTITETPAICAYLADSFPKAGLAPALDDPARGPYLRWLFFCAGPLESAIINSTLGFQVPKEREAMAGYGSLIKVLDVIDAAVDPACNGGRDYLLGAHFTAADVYLAAQLGLGMMFQSIEPRPAFVAYARKMSGRPAAVRARQMDDALAPKPAG
jgi:glutathione S-transferase